MWRTVRVSHLRRFSKLIAKDLRADFAFWTHSGSNNEGSCDGSLQRSVDDTVDDCDFLSNFLFHAGSCVRVSFASVTVTQEAVRHGWDGCSNDREVLVYDGNTLIAVCPKKV